VYLRKGLVGRGAAYRKDVVVTQLGELKREGPKSRNDPCLERKIAHTAPMCPGQLCLERGENARDDGRARKAEEGGGDRESNFEAVVAARQSSSATREVLEEGSLKKSTEWIPARTSLERTRGRGNLAWPAPCVEQQMGVPRCRNQKKKAAKWSIQQLRVNLRPSEIEGAEDGDSRVI